MSRRIIIALGVGLVWRGLAAGGRITFNTALPVHVGELIFRQQAIWLHATDDPTALDRRLNV